MKKISVIIPIYNVEKYLKDCINSVINQTYKNLEIILVDDGATDSSGIICDNYAQKDDRIKVIHKKNGGLSSARNEGMKIATGELISFVDGDDYIASDFYEYLYSIMEKNDADISEAEFVRIPEEIVNNAELIISDKNNQIIVKEYIYTNMDALNLLYGINEHEYVKKVVVWNKLYKKKLFENIIFPQGKLHEDEFTTYKVLYNAEKIVSSTKYIHGYVQTQKSIMRTEITQKRIDHSLESVETALNFFDEKKLPELKAMIMMRYLDICIELFWKISNELSDSKVQKLEYLRKEYICFFEKNMIEYKKYIFTETDRNFYKILEKTYNHASKNEVLDKYYNDIKKLKESK